MTQTSNLKQKNEFIFTELDDIEFKFTDVLMIRDAFEKYGHGEKISHGIFIVDSDLSLGIAYSGEHEHRFWFMVNTCTV